MMGNESPETGIKKKILEGIQGDMARRRLLNITVDLDKGTVESDGQEPENGNPDQMGPEAGNDTDLGQPTDVLSRLRKVAR